MIKNDTTFMSDEDFRVLVNQTREDAYTFEDLEDLAWTAQILLWEWQRMVKHGNQHDAYPIWVEARVYSNVHCEKIKALERLNKIEQLLSDEKDTDFINSLDLKSLFDN